jgi:hypothetical protein
MTVGSVVPTGYSDAMCVCERMVDETIHKHPDRCKAMFDRPGEVARSSTSIYWNLFELLPFIIKPSQTLGVLLDFEGVRSIMGARQCHCCYICRPAGGTGLPSSSSVLLHGQSYTATIEMIAVVAGELRILS